MAKVTDTHDIEARLRETCGAPGCARGNFSKCPPCGERAEAADEIARLRADFLRYADHGLDADGALCAWVAGQRRGEFERCTCGLDAARKRAGGS